VRSEPDAELILDATRSTGNPLTVAFNYRYNPVHEQVWRLLREQAIGEVLSVHFAWRSVTIAASVPGNGKKFSPGT
jgi:predicted dehydrogenase